MFKNYFKIAWRNLVKQKMLTFINVFGLSVGIACFALFLLYVINEFSFDCFNKDAKNIYQVNLWAQFLGSDKPMYGTYLPYPLGPALKQDFAYRINISWWIFVAAGFAAIAIALITVSFRTIKAAMSNPMKSLRSE